MRIHVRSKGIEEGKAVSDYARKRLAFAIGRFDWAVRAVSIRLEDVNGPRGGVDKRCVVRASGDDLDERVVEVADVSAFAAIDRAMEILRRAVARALGRGAPARSRVSLRRQAVLA